MQPHLLLFGNILRVKSSNFGQNLRSGVSLEDENVPHTHLAHVKVGHVILTDHQKATSIESVFCVWAMLDASLHSVYGTYPNLSYSPITLPFTVHAWIIFKHVHIQAHQDVCAITSSSAGSCLSRNQISMHQIWICRNANEFQEQWDKDFLILKHPLTHCFETRYIFEATLQVIKTCFIYLISLIQEYFVLYYFF